MNKDNFIKSTSFRSHITIEDIYEPFNYETIEVWNGTDYEEILDLSDHDLRYPNMSYSFSHKIISPVSSLLERFVQDLLYLNACMSPENDTKMAEYIIHTMVLFRNGKPVVNNETIQKVIKDSREKENHNQWEPTTTKLILFSKFSLISKEEKRQMAMQMRHTKNRKLKEALIHNMAEYLIESTDHIKVTDKTVHTNLDYVKGFRTLRSVRTHMGERTLQMLSDASEHRYFKSAKELDKFLLYNDLIELGWPTKVMVKELKTSYSTLSKFASIREQLVFNGTKLL